MCSPSGAGSIANLGGKGGGQIEGGSVGILALKIFKSQAFYQTVYSNTTDRAADQITKRVTSRKKKKHE